MTSHAGSPARSRFDRATATNDSRRSFYRMSNEETPTTEQPRALAMAMRAGGRKKAAPKKKAGRKAAPKKAAAKKNGRKKGAYGKKAAAPKKAGRKVAGKK